MKRKSRHDKVQHPVTVSLIKHYTCLADLELLNFYETDIWHGHYSVDGELTFGGVGILKF